MRYPNLVAFQRLIRQLRTPSMLPAHYRIKQHIQELIPKLEDPDSCYVRRHWDIHCKNVRRSNGIWAPCSGADDVADESMSRWEYHAHNFLGFVQLACLVIHFKRF